jgi:glycosyltransferase involved in cell wall biosynthesis
VHVLFVHNTFPAQFGHIAAHLVRTRGWRCSFVSQTEPGEVEGIRKIQYRPAGGATERTHYFARTFENALAHATGVYVACRPLRLRLKPDLIVGHSGFGSTLFLPELWPEAPVVNYFEYFYRPRESDIDFRPDFPVDEADVLRSRARNAMILLDLEYCAAGYSPTEFQRSLFPDAYQHKLRVLHDGIDTELWRRHEVERPEWLPEGKQLVTYVSRGLEAMRGFDIFMRMAKLVYEAEPDVVFAVVGADRVAYGGDLKYIAEPTFKEHVLAQDDYDLERIRFLGNVAPQELARLVSLSDLHVYLTVPFVLSWSLLDAMACGCPVLASGTAPVGEIVRDGESGVLRDFFDVEGLADAALELLRDRERARQLGDAAAATIREQYALEKTLPELAAFFEQVAL